MDMRLLNLRQALMSESGRFDWFRMIWIQAGKRGIDI